MPLTIWFQPINPGQPSDKVPSMAAAQYDVVPTWHKNQDKLIGFPKANDVVVAIGPGPGGYNIIAPVPGVTRVFTLSSTANITTNMVTFDINSHTQTTTYWGQNATIASVTSSAVTFSQDTTSSPALGTKIYFAVTTTNKTGTPQGNTTITVNSATGIIVGMYVYTTGLPNKYADGTTVTNVSGTTITTSAGPLLATVNSGTAHFFVLP